MKKTGHSQQMLTFASAAKGDATVTAQAVARHLGLSVSTIGRALADDPRISPATKTRVREAAESLGYVANEAARVMRGGSSKLVGLVLPDIRNDFYATIAQALSACCDREGYRLALCITEDDRELEARQVKELVAARVAGIIVVPTANPRREALAMLCSLPRVQLLRNLPALSADWFGIDDEHCMQAGTRHLLDLGHRRVAYIGGEPSLPTGAARVSGFRAAFRGAGVDPASAVEELGSTTVAFGAQAAARLLACGTPPTAIITGSVQVTLGVLETLHARKVAVPDQLSIVGFGDPSWFKWWREGLTTLQMPIEELATACGLWFLNRLRSKSVGQRPHASITRASLVIRGTTAPPAKTSSITMARVAIGTTKR
ncbi:LacI family DNA-binding transcriptional regulator [Lichenicoccus sp.]|uniref:LacI family DNA-binding transcriptional regulator n=1 Tax=Lichenicoccus sp. TaxID=2781899 RepID=UPI003D14EF88